MLVKKDVWRIGDCSVLEACLKFELITSSILASILLINDSGGF